MLLVVGKILLTLILAVFAGCMFRLGGSANTHARWLRMFGISMAEVGCLWIWFGFSWWLIIIAGLAWTECTYFKSKGTDAKWWNWLLCGIQYALIPIPLVIAGDISWMGLLNRSIILIPAITIWRTLMGDVDWSEGGAGAWQILTIPLLCLKGFFH